jgi:predicted DsbA family dithiol-disulfide isomerase
LVSYLTHHKAVSFLKSDEMEQEINEMCEKARDMGIKGVPLTIIDGKWALSGGQSSDVFVQVCLPSIYHIIPSDDLSLVL